MPSARRDLQDGGVHLDEVADGEPGPDAGGDGGARKELRPPVGTAA